MSDDTPTPIEAPAPQAEASTESAEDTTKRTNKSATLIGCLIAVVIVALILLGIWLLRGCNPSQTTRRVKAPAAQESTSSAEVATIALDDKVHTALHNQLLPGGDPLDTLVYIFEVKTGNGVEVVITLTPLTGGPKTTSQSVAAACEKAVMAGVPEVTKVTVLDANRVAVSSVTR